MLRPLSIYHVTQPLSTSTPAAIKAAVYDHWYWCRSCHRPEHCDWTMAGCTRIGPFMTEAEAQVCAALPRPQVTHE